MSRVRCANSPGAWAKLTDLDRDFVRWFRAYLEWSASAEATRGPEPAQPDPADYPGPTHAYAPAAPETGDATR